MKGEDMRAYRERQGLNQPEFAVWLNERLGRKYDKQKISRWENDAERIPQQVETLIRRDMLGIERQGGPALIVAVANQKGGVAKTVTSVNVATALAQKGFATLLLDMDPQANATMHLGIDTYALEAEGKTLYYALHGDVALRDIVVTVDTTGLRVAPSSIRLAESEVELDKEAGGEMVLKEVLADVGALYDFIVIDTPPNIGELTKNALAAAHTVAVPCQTEQFSVLGIRFLLDNIAKIRRRMNTGLGILGIVPTLYKEREKNDRLMLADLQEQYASRIRVYPPVPKAATYAQATTVGRAALEAAPDVPGAAVYHEVTADLIREREARLDALVKDCEARKDLTHVA